MPAFHSHPGPFLKGADLLLVTIDTLRADSVGFAGNRRVETPVLDRLAAAGRVFTDAHAHNVITLPSSCISIGHPAAFPVELPEFFIKLMTKEGDLVIDPFMGSGTTALAAQPLGRHFLGIDSDEEYVALADGRILSAAQAVRSDTRGAR